MLGKVTVTSRNQYQNTINEIERRFVFIGKTPKTELYGVVTHLNAQTDIEALFSSTPAPSSQDAPEQAESADAVKPKKAKSSVELPPVVPDDNSFLRDVLTAAQINAGANWTASVVGLDSNGDWKAALDLANKQSSYEAVVLTDFVTSKSQLEEVKSKIALIESQQARFMFAMTCSQPVASSEAWADYMTRSASLVDGVKAARVMCIPTLFGNDIGILAGRLCIRSVTVADSPMRVKTGPLLSMGTMSVDKDGKPFPIENLTVLDANRFSVPQTYPGEDGWYWADGNTLDSETGDYKVIENLRVVLKACRRVYKIAIPTIADRSLNSSPNSIARNKNLYMKPLLEMSAPVIINNVRFPGEIEPPKDSAVEINWMSDIKTEIYITVRPINSQKDITIGVGLDLSKNPTGE
ncbi:DUF2586 domain-containing protein [Aliivibrio fischeri]|uniref:Phage tail protein n=1 Tax=Aliivibrio fischeri TaxID=668 RepID=A0A510UJY7_ALIFS|nr:DUF2586 domain-containing protein [Aliivibrio fischeri]GEK13225.1 phage tail protein [Aliivibrio fischeri]